MNEMLHSLSFLSAGVASALFSAIWEGAVLALGVYLCLRLLPGLSAAARSVVWLNVFVLLVLLHFVPAFAGPAANLTGGHVPAVHLDPRWSLVVVAVWATLSLWRAVQLIQGIAHLRRLSRRAVPVEVDAEIQALLAGTKNERAAELCISKEVVRPSVLGFARPRVLVPPALIEHLTPMELQQVVLHEMEHLRRGDDWTNLWQKIGLVLFPLNPVLMWVERRLCAERELACDDRVMQSSAGRKAYALCLARLAEFTLFRRGFSLVLGLWERRPELVRRIQRIVSQPVRSMGRRPAMAATGSLLAGALGCAVALSHSPQLVSFTPAHRPLLEASSLDPHEVARELGGTPRMMKAALTENHPSGANAKGHAAIDEARLKSCPFKAESDSAQCESTGKQQRVHRAVVKAVQRKRAAASQIATVDPVPPPLPILEQPAVIVLTEVLTFQAPPRVVLAVSPDRQTVRPAVIRATYAIVPTPNGWIIIQI
jgi:Zn-dependent protease with chaperone function